jgi:hypothetical protein
MNSDERDVLNYRPILILPVFKKILEKLMCKRLNSFIGKNNVLSNAQFGLRQGKSMEIACQMFLNNIQEAMENKYQVVGLFLNLTKTYDILNHQILLDKLDTYGIRGLTNKWFSFYLLNRTQFVLNYTCGKHYSKEI